MCHPVACPFLLGLVRLRCCFLCLHFYDVSPVVFFCRCWLVCLSYAKTSNAHPAMIAGSMRAEVHAVVQFLAVAPLIFDQFVIARCCLQPRPAIIVCRWVRDLRLNLADWLQPFIWFVHFADDTQALHMCGMNFMAACSQFVSAPASTVGASP